MFGNADRDRRIADLDRRLLKLSTDLSTARAQIERTAGAALSVELSELDAALRALQKTNRREFAKLWGHVSGFGSDTHPTNNGQPRVHEALDPELAAELALQTAPAVAPGR